MTLERKEKNKIYSKKYYQDNKEEMKERKLERRNGSNLEYNSYMRKYYKNNKKAIRARVYKNRERDNLKSKERYYRRKAEGYSYYKLKQEENKKGENNNGV